MQFLVKKGLKEPITSGNGDDFAKAYRRGDINKNNLFEVKEDWYYSHQHENELLLAFMDGKKQGDEGKYTPYSKFFFVPTPIFVKRGKKDRKPIYFNPGHMTWKKTG